MDRSPIFILLFSSFILHSITPSHDLESSGSSKLEVPIKSKAFTLIHRKLFYNNHTQNIETVIDGLLNVLWFPADRHHDVDYNITSIQHRSILNHVLLYISNQKPSFQAFWVPDLNEADK